MIEKWYSLDNISVSDNSETLYCIAVESEDHQFLIGKIGVPTHNTDEAKEQESLKGEAQALIGSIARLGRAAGVYLVIATQRPDAKILPGETKANLGVRIAAGRSDPTASSMILNNGEGTRIKPYPKGRLYVGVYGSGAHCQGFWADENWLDNYLASKGLKADGTPLERKTVKEISNNDQSVSNIQESDEIDTDFVASLNDDAFSYVDSDNEDESWGFDTDSSAVKQAPQKFEGIELDSINTSGSNADKFHRPEDDWTQDLEDLIAENNA